MKRLFQLRFTGGGVKPDAVPARELAELIIAAEEAIASVALQRNPALNPDEIVVGLVQIEEKSLGLSFASLKNKGHQTTIQLVPKAVSWIIILLSAQVSGRFLNGTRI